MMNRVEMAPVLRVPRRVRLFLFTRINEEVNFDANGGSATTAMEVHFTPEQEAQLSEIANQAGTDAEHLVKCAALRLLERDARFRDSVRKGLEQADRGGLWTSRR